MRHLSCELTAALAVLALGASSCGGRLSSTYAEDLAWEPKVILQTDCLTLYSPYSAGVTAHCADLVDAEFRIAQRLFELPDVDGIVLRMVPVVTRTDDADSIRNFMGALRANKDSCGGYVFGGEPGSIVVYMPAEEDDALSALLSKTSTFRHEFAHDFCPRVGLERLPRWLNEGIAETVEHLEFDGERPLWTELTPIAVLETAPPPRAMDRLLAWGPPPGDRTTSATHVATTYTLAHSFTLFLLRSSVGSFRERVRHVSELGEAELRGREDGWRRWQRDADPIAELERTLAADSPSVRRLAIARMGALRGGHPELAREPYPGQVLRALSTRENHVAVAQYFLWRAPRDLADETVRALARSEDPRVLLLGQALLARRDLGPDLELARRVFATLDGETRALCAQEASILRLRD